MELSDNQINRLIEIIQQYSVIYGGGISSKDQRIREECENLIDALEGLRKTKKKKTKKAVETSTEISTTDKSTKKKSQKTEKATKTAKTTTKTKSGKSKRTKEELPNSVSVIEEAIEKTRKEKKTKTATTAKQKTQTPTIQTVKRKKKLHAVHLFDAYKQGKLPKYGGYIVSSNFQPDTNYSIFEIAGYDNVQEIRLEGDSLVFKSAGCKLYVLIEPANYPFKNVEPVQRESDKSIPYRFSELFILTTKKHDTIYIGKKPIISYSSFTIVKPRKNDFAILFYNVPDVFENIQEFLASVFNKGVGILKRDSQKAARITVQGIKNFNTWLDL